MPLVHRTSPRAWLLANRLPAVLLRVVPSIVGRQNDAAEVFGQPVCQAAKGTGFEIDYLYASILEKPCKGQTLVGRVESAGKSSLGCIS